jgi:hypothetical protein
MSTILNHQLLYAFILLMFLSMFPLRSKDVNSNGTSSAFQCLLNIPMGISPAELKRHLSNCQSVILFDINDQRMSKGLDLSSYTNEVLYDIEIPTYSEGQDSLRQLIFSFFKGGLYSIEGIKYFDAETEEEKTDNIVSQLKEQYGTPKLIAKTIYWQTEKWKEKTPNWKIGNKTLSFDTYPSPPEGYLTIKNDSIAKIVSEIRNSSVDIEVLTYEGSNPKGKQTLSPWNYTDAAGNSYGKPRIKTYCEGIGTINLKGKATGLTFTLACEDGTIVFEKTGVSVKGKTTIIKKDQFPENCESKSYSSNSDDPDSAHYTLTVSKMGHPLFIGNIHRDDCME